jgi:adenylate kinase
MNLVFLGPPGAGKGTQAKKLLEEFGMPQISTGDILRDAVRRGTDLGKKAKPLMEAGKLVPDDLVVEIAMEHLRQIDPAQGFILDGFPRTIPQAVALDSALKKSGEKIDAAISLRVPEETLVERLSGRRSCPKDGSVYHVSQNPSKREGLCDKCGSSLLQREDDKPEKVRERLAVYARQTAPLEAYYDKQGLLRVINGVGSPEDIYAQIKKILSRS